MHHVGGPPGDEEGPLGSDQRGIQPLSKRYGESLVERGVQQQVRPIQQRVRRRHQQEDDEHREERRLKADRGKEAGDRGCQPACLSVIDGQANRLQQRDEKEETRTFGKREPDGEQERGAKPPPQLADCQEEEALDRRQCAGGGRHCIRRHATGTAAALG